jgi:hypothetical protein
MRLGDHSNDDLQMLLPCDESVQRHIGDTVKEILYLVHFAFNPKSFLDALLSILSLFISFIITWLRVRALNSLKLLHHSSLHRLLQSPQCVRLEEVREDLIRDVLPKSLLKVASNPHPILSLLRRLKERVL